ncbi:MAG: hypothetical protein ABSA47_06870 [Verrucomicrobiota bacterium]
MVALRKLAGSVPPSGETCVAAFQKNKGTEIRIGLVPPDAETSLPSIDIREHVTSESYTGFTKKGIRFCWDKLPEVLRLFEVQLAALRVAATEDPTLFPQVQPKSVETAKTADGPTQAASPLDEMLGPLPGFPMGFQPTDAVMGEAIHLPSDSLELKVNRLGQWFVASMSGFEQKVQNEVEGKFLLYAQQRGQTTVALPKAMIHIFKTVTAYEKHCRELRQRIVRTLETKSGNRQLADFQTRQLFAKHRLPAS